MPHLRYLLIVVSLMLGTTLAGMAQDLDKGLDAYNAGDYEAALTEWRPLANQGDASAQYNLGNMYDDSLGIPQDYPEALKWYRLAADQGHASAQNNLGVMYEYGKGVLQSNVMAHMWYNIASANGANQAGKWRDEIAGKMTNADVSKAQAMASECMGSGYKNCGQ